MNSTYRSGGQGGDGVDMGGAGSVTNTGTILGGRGGVALGEYGHPTAGMPYFPDYHTGNGGAGISMAGLDTITNLGTIRGGAAGASYFDRYAASLLGTLGQGIAMHGAGAVFNGTSWGSTANISGGTGVSDTGGPATVVNFGTISGSNGAGIALNGGGTVFDAGTISGGNGTAVSFGGTGGSRLVLAPGYVLNGAIVVSGTANVLELAPATGTLSNFNLGLFNTVAVDAAASWSFAGSASISALMRVTNSGTIRLAGTLTNAGQVTASGDAIDGGAVAVALSNSGTILAGAGASGATGGTAVNLTAGGTFFSSGIVAGGAGGSGGAGGTVNVYGDAGGSGGAGIALAGDFSATNLGAVSGGAGGSGGYGNQNGGAGGTGGTGAAVAGTFTNAGTVSGGSGGGSGSAVYYGASGGGGGTGILLAEGSSLVNTGLIAGGNGANGSYGREHGGNGGNGGAGISMAGLGSVTNTGIILGGSDGGGGPGKYGPGGAAGSSGAGVLVAAGGTVTNGTSAGGTAAIRGGVGLYAAGGKLTVTNFGAISGTAGAGIALNGGGTVFDAGTISGANGTAVAFGGTGGNRLILAPGYAISGAVAAAGTGNVLELASGAAGGTLSSPGGLIGGFGSIAVDTGAVWTLAGNASIGAGTALTNDGSLIVDHTTLTDAGTLVNNGGILIDPSSVTLGALTGAGSVTIAADSTLSVLGMIAASETIVFAGQGATLVLGSPDQASGLIEGFVAGDTIDLSGVVPMSESYDAATGKLGFALASGGTGQIDLPGAGAIAFASLGSGVDAVTALCFCAGTLIRTPKGDVPVQALKTGDIVRTWDGGSRPVTWIGQGKVLATRNRRNAATPVIVRKGALADNVPAMDLRVTKGHCLLQDGVLIPVEFLVNHRSIQWDDHAQEVTLYHVELDSHDVVIANGAPAESYRDDGNRWLFQNANEGWGLPPKPPCAPVLTGGPVVDAVWARLLKRSGPRSGIPVTDEPDLHLLVAGQRINPTMISDRTAIFPLPDGDETVWVKSRSGVPAELGTARDPRELGVAIGGIVVRSGSRFRVIEAADTRLVEGFHAYEPGGRLRWTDGQANLPRCLWPGFAAWSKLELHFSGATSYPADAMSPAARSSRSTNATTAKNQMLPGR